MLNDLTLNARRLFGAAALAFPMILMGISSCPSSDADGDGYTTSAGDCDDSDAAVYPGAAEICDDIDNNCDGLAPPCLVIHDATNDTGSEPSWPAYHYLSPDISVTTASYGSAPATLPPTTNAETGWTNYVYAQATNMNTDAVHNVFAHVYVHEAIGASWFPTTWTHIGSSFISDLQPGQTKVLPPVAWNVPAVVLLPHWCVIVVLSGDEDNFTVPGFPADSYSFIVNNNNAAQRNVNLVNEKHNIFQHLLQNLNEKLKTVDLRVDMVQFPLNGQYVLKMDPKLMESWLAAGGKVECGRTSTSTGEIYFTGTGKDQVCRIYGIPLAYEEETELSSTIKIADYNSRYNVILAQETTDDNGKVLEVGGNQFASPVTPTVKGLTLYSESMYYTADAKNVFNVKVFGEGGIQAPDKTLVSLKASSGTLSAAQVYTVGGVASFTLDPGASTGPINVQAVTDNAVTGVVLLNPKQ